MRCSVGRISLSSNQDRQTGAAGAYRGYIRAKLQREQQDTINGEEHIGIVLLEGKETHSHNEEADGSGEESRDLQVLKRHIRHECDGGEDSWYACAQCHDLFPGSVHHVLVGRDIVVVAVLHGP